MADSEKIGVRFLVRKSDWDNFKKNAKASGYLTASELLRKFIISFKGEKDG